MPQNSCKFLINSAFDYTEHPHTQAAAHIQIVLRYEHELRKGGAQPSHAGGAVSMCEHVADSTCTTIAQYTQHSGISNRLWAHGL